MDRIERIDRKVVKKAHIFDLCEDKIKLPDGNIVYYDTLLHKGAAAVLPVLEDGRILLIRQFRNAIDRYSLEIPSGGREEKEDYESAAKRELQEETGYRAGRLWHLLSFHSAMAFSNEKLEIYVAEELIEGEGDPDPEEFIQVCPYSLVELNSLIWEGKIQDSKTIAAIMSYQVYNKEK